MEISPLEVYLVMQADEFSSIFYFFSGLFVIAMIASLVACAITSAESDEDDRKIFSRSKKLLYILSIPTFIFVTLATITPTTKTLAVMYILPKIANSKFVNEDLPNETKEIYGLAKEALKNAVDKKEK